MKKITLTLFLTALSFALYAQINYYKYTVGAGVGTTLTYADVAKKTFALSGYGTLEYNFTPFVNLGLEVQKGELAGGDINDDPYNRQFVNSYLSYAVNLKLQLGEFLTAQQRRNVFLDNIRGLYAGVGFGYIHNKVSNVRYSGSTYYPGADKSKEGIVPFNLGINFYFPDKWGYSQYIFNANLQSTIAIGEGIDGYGHSTPERNDIYSLFSIGVKYQFGPKGLDKRR